MTGADSWNHREIFQVEEKSGKPDAVSGVPPDYFSETGQRWGNPLYSWFDGKEVNKKTLDWWISRISHLGTMVDIIRIDHFRGFESYWSIPAEEKTAIKGEWVEGPGLDFFRKLRQGIGDLNLIAEDLGVITPEVEELRDNLGLPGMKILQFAFDFNNRNSYLPHNIEKSNFILYTGTHDNNTTNGWFYGDEIDNSRRKYILEYLGSENFSDIHMQLIRAAYRSIADLVIIPVQDIIGFGEKFRMNIPGTTKGNWIWKLKPGDLTEDHLKKMRRMGEIYRRLPEREEDDGNQQVD
jgi:4-alpha-glucanotransferase